MPDPVVPSQPGVTKEPVIYTIPEQFYGLAAKAQLPREQAMTKAVVAAPTTTVITPAPPKPAPPSKSKKWMLIPAIALLLLIGMGVAVWWFLREPPAAQPTTPVVTLPTPVPEPQPTPEPEPQPEPVPEPLVAKDTDNDGLTDEEEERIYKTDMTKSDTDEDGYSDSVEVINLYNPAGFKPTKLIEAKLVQLYVSTTGTFQVLYPSVVSPPENNVPTRFLFGGFEYFEITREQNTEEQSVLDWYLTRNSGISPVQVQQFFTKSGLEGVRSPDGMTAYIAIDGAVYRLANVIVVSDGSGDGLALPQTRPDELRATFTMFINSFSKKP